MQSGAPRRLTNAELCEKADALPAPLVGEVIDGILYTMGRPTPAHATVEVQLGSDLVTGRHGGGPPPSGWYIRPEVEIRFPSDEKTVPDLSGWYNDRIAGHRNDNPIRIVPDWVCEILSDSTKKKDMGVKRELYARHGVGHLWLIDPEEHWLEAFVLEPDRRWKLLGMWVEADVAIIPPFTETKLALANWWLTEK
jgi:Uma2 family endonuclease